MPHLMENCEICGKPTTSHRIKEYHVCHSCWLNKTEEVEGLKTQAEEEKVHRDQVENSGKDISGKLDNVKAKEDIFSVMDEYQKRLNDSMELDPGGGMFRRIENEVSEKFSNVLFEFTEKEGWPFILELIDRYGPDNPDMIDNIPVEDVTGRMIIHTRVNEGVEKIPIEALEYLTSFHDAPDIEWEDSFVCGWGFNHPDFDFKEIIERSLEYDEYLWVSALLERAFYADQKKAAPILIDLLKRDDISLIIKMGLVQSITFFTDREGWDMPDCSPRYWNWKEAIGYRSFDWDEEVERSLKEVIEEKLKDYIEDGQSMNIGMSERTWLNIPAYRCDFSKGWSFIDLQT